MPENVWEQFYRIRNRFYLVPHAQFQKVIRKFKSYKVHKVLDIGCGSGRHSITLAKSGFKVVGIDYSKEALKLAEKWAKHEKLKVQFDHGNFHAHMSYLPESFDGIIAIDALHYDTTDSLKFTLQEMVRLLRPGGVIFATFPTQICNPLVTHLIFSADEIKKFMNEYFTILETFFDETKFLCVFALKSKKK